MTFLSRLFPDRKHALMASARTIAADELRRAVIAGDTRRINTARLAMAEATHALMRHELEKRKC